MQTTYAQLQHFLSLLWMQMNLQNMEIFVIKERYHCYHTKRGQKIKAQVIKHMHKRKEKFCQGCLNRLVAAISHCIEFHRRQKKKKNQTTTEKYHFTCPDLIFFLGHVLVALVREKGFWARC